jgi:hypothetical protein
MTEINSPQSGGKVYAPRGLGSAGRKLWDAGLEGFEWSHHELVLLEQSARIADRIVELDKLVADSGLMLKSSQGLRCHPAIAESRAQRLALARLLVSLRIPPLTDISMPLARSVRGTYGGGR